MKREVRAGLYLTIVVHLSILIVVLSYGIVRISRSEPAFMINFSKQEELEKQAAKEAMRAVLSQEIDDILADVKKNTRNVIVNRNQKLKDDRFKNPEQVYEEAKALQERLDAAQREALAQEGDGALADMRNPARKENAPAYTGPSVLEYTLEGRKALKMPIPVYKCFGGGDVTLSIEVNPKGYVVAAAVVAAFSSEDRCLQEYALKAARQSRFTADSKAPPRQRGRIVYRFMAQ